MTDTIEHYDNFNTKGCPYELIFDNFNDQPIPPDYYDFLNDEDEYVSNIPGTPVGNFLADKNVTEDEVVPNDESSTTRQLLMMMIALLQLLTTSKTKLR